MKETENGTPCCENNNAESSCGCASGSCCGTPSGRKVKLLVCLVVLLAIAGIAAYKLSLAPRNAEGGTCCPGKSPCQTSAECEGTNCASAASACCPE